MAAIVAITLFLLLASVITLYGYRAYVQPARYFEHLTPSQKEQVNSAGPGGRRAAIRIFEQIGDSIRSSGENSLPDQRELTAAGFRSEGAVAIYYGIRITVAIALLLLSLLIVPGIIKNGLLRIVLGVAATATGFFLPGLILERMVRARQRRIRIGLADALDLMVIVVESGVGMDQALTSVTKELRATHQDLTDEFALASLEMRAGIRRTDALRNLADRTGEREVKKLVAVLVQTDRFGTSIADALRVHADFMRVARRLAAEEKAGKLAVKLVFPIFFLIMPSMMLVVAGPGLLQIVRVLLPTLRNVP